MAVVQIGTSPTNQTLSAYSIAEDSTPVDPSDTSGGISQATFTIQTPTGWKSYRKNPVTITDETQGVTTAVITDVSDTQGVLSVTANSRLGNAGVIRTALPYTGTLGGAILYYLGLVNLTTGIVIDNSLMSIPVTFQGWNGDVYLYVTKMLGPAYGFEVSLVGNNIVCRPFRTRTAVTYRESAATTTVSAGNAAQTVQVDWYASTFKTNALAYPPGGYNPSVTVYQVDAGATVTITDIPLDTGATTGDVGSSITSIQQPVCVLNVTQNYSATSVYAIAGNDGLPITPAQWAATGGSLTLTINPDTKSLSMILTGSSISQYGPYRVAMSSGSSNYYSSLRIVGTGVFTTKNQITLSTALSIDDAPQVLGTEVDSPFITSLAQAYDKGIWALAHYSALTQTITVNAAGINRIDDTGSYAYPTIQQFDATYAGQTIAQFDTTWAGQTIQQFDDYWNAQVSGTFANQAFGNLGGARVPRSDAFYRIRSASNSVGQISYTAEMDTTVADFDALWVNKTISDFDAFWFTKTLEDFDVGPLLYPLPQSSSVANPLIYDIGDTYDSTYLLS